MNGDLQSVLCRVFVIVAGACAILNCQFSNPDRLCGQPTYKLDVKPDLKPLAQLKLEGTKVTRSELTDDPGFRLQFHVRAADGKSILVAEARSTASHELPTQTPGRFTVVLELFYPAYKGGTGQKGEFNPVSDILTYKVEGGKVALVPLPKATAIY